MRYILPLLFMAGLLCSAEIQDQTSSVLDIKNGAYANARLLGNLELQAGRSADVVITVDIEQVAADGKQTVYKGVLLTGTAKQAKIGDRIDVKLAKLVWVAASGQVVETKVDGFVSDSDGKDGVTPSAKTMPVQSNLAAVINTIGPVINVDKERRFTVVITNPIKAN